MANPNKNKSVHDILLKNQKKLIEFLEMFTATKGNLLSLIIDVADLLLIIEDDLQFLEEKLFLIHQIQDLCPQPREREHVLEMS